MLASCQSVDLGESLEVQDLRGYSPAHDGARPVPRLPFLDQAGPQAGRRHRQMFLQAQESYPNGVELEDDTPRFGPQSDLGYSQRARRTDGWRPRGLSMADLVQSETPQGDMMDGLVARKGAARTERSCGSMLADLDCFDLVLDDSKSKSAPGARSVDPMPGMPPDIDLLWGLTGGQPATLSIRREASRGRANKRDQGRQGGLRCASGPHAADAGAGGEVPNAGPVDACVVQLSTLEAGEVLHPAMLAPQANGHASRALQRRRGMPRCD